MTQHAGEWILNSIKKNPEGLLLVAAGCALLLRAGTSKQRRSGASQSGITEQVEKKAEEYARQAGESASHYASQASEYAATAAQNLKQGSERVVDRMQSSVSATAGNLVERQPLAVVAVGLLAGAAVAAAFPATDLELKAVGPIGDELRNATSDLTNRLSKGAEAASDRLKQTANERGLNVEGVKEVAAELAEAFTGQVSGDRTDAKNPTQKVPPSTAKPSYP